MGKIENNKRHYQKHRDRIKARCLKYAYEFVLPKQKKITERKRKKKKTAREWQNKNREHLNLYMKKWREDNKESWKKINDRAYQTRKEKKLKKKMLDILRCRKLKKLRAQKGNIMIGKLFEMYPKYEVLAWVA